LIDNVIQHLEANKIPLSIFLDLSKAFDTLNHDILLNKLKHYGITGKSYDLCTNYLTNRSQYIIINNTKSTLKPIITGVPQGSILGPFFFLIYVNDFHKCCNSLSMIHYADDTTLTTTINAPLDNSAIISQLNAVYDWLTANKLVLNVKKTKFMIFRTKNKCIPNPPKLEINKIPIEEVDTFNFLGITINNKLTWAPHINKISTKIARTVGVLHRLKDIIPSRILLLIYQALISPHLNYGILIWGHNPTNNIKTLQKKAVRAIANAKYNAHTDPLFKKLKLLKITDIRKLQELKFYHKQQNNKLPSKFQTNFIQTNSELNSNTLSIDTRNRNRLSIPRHRLELFKNSLRYTIVSTVNNTPPNIIARTYTHSIEAYAIP